MNGTVVLAALYLAAGASAPSPNASIPLDQVSIGLERTECFGTCPVYRLTISGRGLVRYEGLQHVDAIGIHESEIEIEAVVDLVNRFLKARFFDCLEEYVYGDMVVLEGDELKRGAVFVSDGASTILRLRLGDEEKKVVLYHDYPAELGELADEIDRAAGTGRWVHGE